MFDQKFNPEFHWQMYQKKKNYKIFLFVFLILILFLSIFFIFKKYYFISGRNISLDQLVPDNTKTLLTINVEDILKNEKGSLIFEKGLKDFLENDEKIQSFIRGIGKDVYWLENSSNSQAFLFKAVEINLIKNIFNTSGDNPDNIIDFNNKLIYELEVANVNNSFLPTLENKIYITYLNNYLFCMSNNLDFIKDVIDKYKESLKIDYFRSIKDELTSYFDEQRTLMLKIMDYDDIDNSLSWVKNLAFIIQEEDDTSFVIKFKISSRKAELLFNNSQDTTQRFDISRMSENLLEDYLIYYSNLGIEYNSGILNLSNTLDNFLKNNIEGLYNINFKEELLNITSPYYFLMYSDNNFLIINKDSEKMRSIYQNILADFKPQTRIMVLPDGKNAIEYYIDPKIINLKEQEINNLVWFYEDLPQNPGFYLVKYGDYYVLTNFKEKVIELSENQEKFCKILRCDKERPLNEILMLNLANIDQKEYLPWLDLFSNSYNKLNFINFTENGENKAFFELIH
jgi:hypothetical protein